MKRIFIALGIMAAVLPATAQYLNQQMAMPQAVKIDANVIQQGVSTSIRNADDAFADEPAAMYMTPRLKDMPDKALYNRPAGVFYLDHCNNGSMFGVPYWLVKPYAVTTFNAITEGMDETAQYHWLAQGYDNGTGHREWLDWYEPEMKIRWTIFETDSVPKLSVTYGGDTRTYWPGGWSSKGPFQPSHVVLYPHSDAYVAFVKQYMDQTITYSKIYCTSKYFGAKDRDNYNKGMIYMSDHTGGMVLGKTNDAVGKKWNIMASAFEKPENPYAIRRVAIYYGYLECTGPAQLWTKVYKLNSIPQQDPVNCARLRPADLELVAQGTATINQNSPFDGIVEFPLSVTEGGMTYEKYLHVDYPILVVVGGYDNSNITSFTLYTSTDDWDEGYGELGWIGQYRDGAVRGFYGLTGFDTRDLAKVGYTNTAPTILLDVENPHLLNFNVGENSHTFPKAGGSYTITVSSYRGGGEWDVTDEDGNDLPSWITWSYVDDKNDNPYYPTYNVTVKINVAALPAGSEGRQCTMHFGYPGIVMPFTITQGDYQPEPKLGDVNGDDSIDVTDVTALITYILGTTPPGFVLANANVDGEGDISVTDVTALINLILK